MGKNAIKISSKKAGVLFSPEVQQEKPTAEKPVIEKKPLPIPQTIRDPRAIRAQLSATIAKQNKIGELLNSSKERGEFTKKGIPRQDAPQSVKDLYEQQQINRKQIAQLRTDLEAAKIKSEAPPPKKVSQVQELENIRTEIASLESIMNIPANKKLRKGIGKRSDIERIRKLVHRVGELKRQQKALKEQIGETHHILKDVHQIDETARVTRDAAPKTNMGITETDYTFSALGIEGKIQSVSIQGQPDIYYARSLDGKKATFGSDTAAEAIRELRQQEPRKITQTGKPVLDVKGDVPSKSTGKTVSALHSSPKVVRTEIESRKEGETYRKMKIFLEGGKIATVYITARGKVVDINKKTGLPNKSLRFNQVLKDNPDLIDLINNPKNAKVTTKIRLNTDPDVDHAIKDPMSYTEKGRDFARKIRARKYVSPRGALRASLGFEEVYNAALEIAATIMESGGQFVDALRAAMKHIRLSEWYDKLPPDQQILRENQAEEEIVKAYMEAGIPLDGKKISEEVKAEQARIEKENVKLRKDEIQRIIFDRRAAIAVSSYQTRLFVEAINQQTNKLEREILPFIIEKTGIPKNLNRPDLEKAYAERDVQKLDRIAKEIKDHNDAVWEQMTEGKEDMQQDLVQDYITHIWDIPKNKFTDVVTYFTTNNKWANKRYIRTLYEGIDRFKLSPKMLDISQILTVHGSMANNVQANRQMLEDLKNIRIGGKRVILHNSTSPPFNWVTIDHPSLRSFKVQPDVANLLNPIFQRTIGKDKKIVQAIEKANGGIKSMQLTISLFHHGALIEAGLPLLGLRTFDAVFKQSIGRGLLAAKSKINGNQTWAQLPYAFQKSVLAEDALEHGVQLGASIDIRVQQLESMFESVTKWAEKGGKVIGGKKGGFIFKLLPMLAQGTIEANNALLWDYLHDTLKLMAYENLVRKIPDKYDTPDLIRKYKIEQGQFVNDSFGGQNFDVLGMSPLMVQIARWGLLSPDWTISTLRQAAPFVLGIPYYGVRAFGATKAAAAIGKAMGAQFAETAGVRAQTGINFWWKAGLIYTIAYSMYNWWERDKDMKEHPEAYTKEEIDNPLSRSMWHNTQGHRTHVFAGRFDDGQERYLRVGKQFRELPELFIDDVPGISVSFPKPFVKKLGGKLSPLSQILLKTFTGKSGSGYEDYEMKDKNSWEWSAAWAKSIATSLGPFSFAAAYRDDKEFNISDLIFPASKGMSFSKGLTYLKHYMAKGDADTMTLIMREAMRNGLNHRALFTAALTEFKAEQATELAREIKTIGDAYKTLQSGKLSEKEYKILENRVKRIERDNDERIAGEELIIKNLEDWIKFQEETGDLKERDMKALEKATESLM